MALLDVLKGNTKNKANAEKKAAEMKKKSSKPKQYVMEDMSRDLPNNDFIKKPMGEFGIKNLGHVVMVGPGNQWAKINLTTPPGGCSRIYYPLLFQLRKWEYQVFKADEWLEVSPIHAQYYQLTEKQKEELEVKIKAGLASAAQTVGDLELLKHDHRRYKEFNNYFEQNDEHSLRAVFIDQVDMHTGDNSIRNIVTRWPMLIIDFMKLADTDMDPAEIKKKLEISKAEAVVLVTKNKLYKQWKELFKPQLEQRLLRIEELIRSREKSLTEYREWLKPLITRHKLLKEGFDRPDQRKRIMTFFIPGGGHATSMSEVTMWAWRDFVSSELKKPSGEIIGKKPINPYDEWTKRELIFHPEQGLIAKYDWITKKWVDDQVKSIKTSGLMNLDRIYYTFFEIKFIRSNIRLADGSEVEDGIFDINTLLFSQNALLVKILELRAKEEELERYVNELLGLPTLPEPEEKPYQYKEPMKLPTFGLKFFKRGPYERDLDDRITKLYMKTMATTRFLPIVSFIKQKIAMGE
ncbi:MAG: hypothetical protein HZB67_01440 [Candidatus Aenigmarchaeota archaeon]|nr:hypothetical protein [Candidatus Aenigmarchaeota archaeon]